MDKKKTVLYIVTAVLGIGLILFLGSKILSGSSKNTNNAQVLGKDQSTNTKIDINKVFEFDAISINKTKKPITFTIVDTEKKDQISVKNETRIAPTGKEFLLLRLELENKDTQKLALTPSDFIRLDVDGKLFAPDYHNGSVIIEPISIRKDVVSFVIDKLDKNIALQVGELTKVEKERIELNF